MIASEPPATQAEAIVDLATLVGNAMPDLEQRQIDQLIAYRNLLLARNARMNLTAVRDQPGMDRRLILESLRLIEPIRATTPIDGPGDRTLMDIGTGGGLPGMVIAITCPDLSVYLLDATGKKVAFLEEVSSEIGLANVVAIHGRAEEIAHQPRYRNAYDLITARAVSSVAALLEMGLPMLRTGGTILLPKSVDIDEELAAGHRAASLLNGEIASADLLADAGTTIGTRLIVVRKTSATPAKYPRRSGIPSRNPLGSIQTSQRNLGGY